MIFPDYRTQTEHVLAIHFGLSENVQETADSLARMILSEGVQMRTGFVGTPYLLHALSDHGYGELAWSLLLREEYPSWLYSVNKGATTVWEHWDGIRENGSFWSADMNSFNHYAYGSVMDWIYEKAAGIRHDENDPGFERAVIGPIPDKRLGWLEAVIDTRKGRISSKWVYEEGGVRFVIETAVPAVIRIGDMQREVSPGRYTFWKTEGSTNVCCVD